MLKPFRQCKPLSPCVTGLQLRYPGVTQETRERALPVIRSARKRTFPLRAGSIVFLGQFDVFVSPQFVTAPCHRFFPVSATLGVARAAHHLPRSNTNTSHGQGLHALLIVLLGVIELKNSHQRSPNAPKFGVRSQEETERDKSDAPAEPRGEWPEVSQSSKKKTKIIFLTYRSLVSPSTIRDKTARAAMHMLRRKDLNSAELETARVSKSPTTVEATVCVKELDLFVTVKLLEDTPAVLSLGNSAKIERTSGQKPHFINDDSRIQCSTENHVPIVVPGLSTGSSSLATYISSFVTARFCSLYIASRNNT